MVKTSFINQDGQHTANRSPNVRPTGSPYLDKGTLSKECKALVNLSKVKNGDGNIQMASCIKFNFTLKITVKSGLNLLMCLT